MKVSIKKLAVSMEIKNTGIELAVYSSGGKTHFGDLIVTKSGLTWCKGRTRARNGQRISWYKLMEMMNRR
jgi:hypothetical protein